MKTSDLIDLLSTDPTRVRRMSPVGAIGSAVTVGGAVALVALALWLGLRPLEVAVRTPTFWMKSVYTLVLAVAGGMLAVRLARPGARPGAALGLALAAFAVMAILGMMEMKHAPPGAGRVLVTGHSWRMCSWRIAALAAPVFVAVILALRQMAPTRLGLAGAAAGLLAGAAGATVYGLYCQETAALFVAAWYTLGVAAWAAIGWILGPRVLRW